MAGANANFEPRAARTIYPEVPDGCDAPACARAGLDAAARPLTFTPSAGRSGHVARRNQVDARRNARGANENLGRRRRPGALVTRERARSRDCLRSARSQNRRRAGPHDRLRRGVTYPWAAGLRRASRRRTHRGSSPSILRRTGPFRRALVGRQAGRRPAPRRRSRSGRFDTRPRPCSPEASPAPRRRPFESLPASSAAVAP